MANVVVVGSQWGDEGKGKIVDWLSERADVVVRFQGGHNAGHTLVIDGVSYKLSLLPSGVVRPGKLAVIGNGVVIDPHALLTEIEKLAGQGVVITPDNLRIADNATLILSLHRELDGIREDAASNSGTKIGTTRRGIGPAYEDKVGRRAIRITDLADRARAKKLSPEEVQGGTFTITNPGVFGTVIGFPIINQPQVAILCVGGIEKRPVVITDEFGNDAIVPRKRGFIALGFDHRLVNGADGDSFLARVKELMESASET